MSFERFRSRLCCPRRTGPPDESKAQAEQVRAVPVDRLGAMSGQLPGHSMAALDEALRLDLDL